MSHSRDLDRKYLEAVLAYLDARLERDVRRWQLAGQNAADRFRGLYISDEEALAVSKRKVGTHWGSGIALSIEETKILEEAESKAQKKMEKLESEAEKAGYQLRLLTLKQKFELAEFEWWAFIVALAPSLDLRYERIYSYLQDDVTQKFASADLILNLLAPEGLERLDYLHYFEPLAALRCNQLILPVESSETQHSSLRQTFIISPAVIAWLLDSYNPSEGLGSGAAYYEAGVEEMDEAAEMLYSRWQIPPLDVLENIGPFLSLYGSDTLQQEMAVVQLAAVAEKPLLKVMLPTQSDEDSLLERVVSAVRDARMLDAWLYLQRADILIDEDGYLNRTCFEVLRKMDAVTVFSSRRTFKFDPVLPNSDHPLMHVPFDDLTALDRKDIWESLLSDLAETIPDTDLSVLSGQFSLTSGQILAASSTALSRALQEGRLLTSDDLFYAAQFHSGHHLAELAQKIAPRYTWDDIVLPENPMSMLKELVQMVQSRPKVLEEWGLGKKLAASNGISALFGGPPGTGKTLAAQIIANELGIDLYRVDLSTVVSKYVGETEKNLEKIFSEASESNAILFFDEADAIFGKRSEVKDAQDRYANLEVGYLLQRMESYNGLAILATNLKANLDDAFTRRLQFLIDFPFPDENYRLKIWEVLIPPSLPVEDELDLALMAKRFKLAGGNIRNIILNAAYYAAEDGNYVTMPHLMHGAKREIQKMGKLVQDSDFAL